MKKTITFLTIFILFFNVIFPLNMKSVQAHSVELDPENYIWLPTTIWGGSGTISISSLVTPSYELYYQYVDVSTSLFNQIAAKNEEAQKYVDEEKTKLEEERASLQTLKTECENIINDSTATEEEKEEARNRYNTAVDEFNTHVNEYNTKVQEFNEAIKELKPSYVESNWTKTTDRSFNVDTSKYIGEFHFVLWAKLVTQDGTYYDESLYSSQGTKEITISLDKTKATMEVGDTLKLKATTNSSDNITWSSNKTDIATVSSEGTVTAKAEGVATITATVGEKSATCIVTVNKPVTETSEIVTINKSSASVKVDETVQLTATSSTSSKITWTSSDSTIATVSSSGLVKGIKQGTAVITAKGSEKTATCKITVTSKETTGESEDDEEWTDFSKAKFELKKMVTLMLLWKFQMLHLIVEVLIICV